MTGGVHFDRTINAGHVLQAVVVAIAAAAFFFGLSGRVSTVEEKAASVPQLVTDVSNNKQAIKKIDEFVLEQRQVNRDITKTLGDINANVAKITGQIEASSRRDQ